MFRADRGANACGVKDVLGGKGHTREWAGSPVLRQVARVGHGLVGADGDERVEVGTLLDPREMVGGDLLSGDVSVADGSRDLEAAPVVQGGVGQCAHAMCSSGSIDGRGTASALG